jgi:hypothetical protein
VKKCSARPTPESNNGHASAGDVGSVRLHEEAETQLLEILDYLAGESETAAVRVRDAIYVAVGKLATNPGMDIRGRT